METQKRKNDIIFKLKQISRHRIYMYLKRKNLTKKNKTSENLTNNFSLLSMEDILFKIYWFGNTRFIGCTSKCVKNS